MIHQLRIDEIFDENRDAFHARLRDRAARLMRKDGFHILDMWETRTDRRLEFVYLLEWADDREREARWKAFMSDHEWSDIKRETGAKHGTMVGAIEDRLLRRPDYPPAPRSTA